MNFDNINSVYLIGIGGIGMSALARYFNYLGKYVAGYDRTSTTLTDELTTENISIHFKDDVNLIPEKIKAESKSSLLVIYTPAISADMKELNYFRDNGYEVYKRSTILGELTRNSFTIAVAGTHGKTTTSSMITHLLKFSGIDCTAFLGGIAKNYKSNFIVGNGKINNKKVVVVEADEFDRSFLTLHPDVCIITSMDADHLDIYQQHAELENTYRKFASQMNNQGVLIHEKALSLGSVDAKKFSYSIDQTADFTAEQIKIINGEYHFNVKTPEKIIENLTIGLPGIHNVSNSLAALITGITLNISEENLRGGLSTYQGVIRRFDYQIKTPNLVFIDDYAHHPEELRACITSVKQIYPGKSILGIFQPHLYSRTRDFAQGFIEVLSLLDELILLNIYPARELPIEGVSSSMLLNKISISNKKLCSKQEVLKEIKDRDIEVLLTLGAGDIDQLVEPIKNILLEKLSNE